MNKKVFTWLALALLALWIIVDIHGNPLWSTIVRIFVPPIIILMAWFDVGERSKKRYALILTLIIFWVTILIGESVQWIASVRIALSVLIIFLALDEDRERKKKENLTEKDDPREPSSEPEE